MFADFFNFKSRQASVIRERASQKSCSFHLCLPIFFNFKSSQASVIRELADQKIHRFHLCLIFPRERSEWVRNIACVKEEASKKMLDNTPIFSQKIGRFLWCFCVFWQPIFSEGRHARACAPFLGFGPFGPPKKRSSQQIVPITRRKRQNVG